MVYHVLKDGSVTEDITGRIVPFKENEALYSLIHSLRHGFSKRKSANTYLKEKNEVVK